MEACSLKKRRKPSPLPKKEEEGGFGPGHFKRDFSFAPEKKTSHERRKRTILGAKGGKRERFCEGSCFN